MFATYTEAFQTTVENHQGKLIELLSAEKSSMATAYFPMLSTHIRQGDEIALGMALFQDEEAGLVSLQAFSYRLVCANGMMRISVMQEPQMVEAPEDLPGEVLRHLDPALHQPRLEGEAEDFRRLQEVPIPPGEIEHMLHRFHRMMGSRWMKVALGRTRLGSRAEQEERHRRREALLRNLRAEVQQNQPLRGDASAPPAATAFDLVNAFTATARDSRDPQEKRKLMVYAGELMDRYLAYGHPSPTQAVRSHFDVRREEILS